MGTTLYTCEYLLTQRNNILNNIYAKKKLMLTKSIYSECCQTNTTDFDQVSWNSTYFNYYKYKFPSLPKYS